MFDLTERRFNIHFASRVFAVDFPYASGGAKVPSFFFVLRFFWPTPFRCSECLFIALHQLGHDVGFADAIIAHERTHFAFAGTTCAGGERADVFLDA